MAHRGLQVLVGATLAVAAGAYLAGARPDIKWDVNQINDNNVSRAIAEMRVEEDPRNANSQFVFWGASLGPNCQPVDETDNPLEYIVNGQEVYCLHREEAPEEQQHHPRHRVYVVTGGERL